MKIFKTELVDANTGIVLNQRYTTKHNMAIRRRNMWGGKHVRITTMTKDEYVTERLVREIDRTMLEAHVNVLYSLKMKHQLCVGLMCYNAYGYEESGAKMTIARYVIDIKNPRKVGKRNLKKIRHEQFTIQSGMPSSYEEIEDAMFGMDGHKWFQYNPGFVTSLFSGCDKEWAQIALNRTSELCECVPTFCELGDYRETNYHQAMEYVY